MARQRTQQQKEVIAMEEEKIISEDERIGRGMSHVQLDMNLLDEEEIHIRDALNSTTKPLVSQKEVVVQKRNVVKVISQFLCLHIPSKFCRKR
jgi:hypothetical protein